MIFEKNTIEGLVIIKPNVFEDKRGYFFESFRKDEFEKNVGNFDFIQDNQSFSSKNILRGLHFQKNPFAQGKLVRVIQGSVLDVAVDIRANSPTYGQHFKVVLSGKNHLQFWVPPGFAHGFLTLSDYADILYKCTDYYAPDDEGHLAWNDADIAINWPLAQNVMPILSDKDANAKQSIHF
mgnify:CR=1 FL=1